MATPFDIKRTTKVGRNGFDMSQRHLFAAAPGQLVPVMCEECLPGDTHRINLSSFTRMRNLKTAPFARFKEYYDVFFVPHYLNWPYFNNMVTNNGEPYPLPVVSQDSVGSEIPSVYLRRLVDAYGQLFVGASNLDFAGMSHFRNFDQLSDMLGYGKITRVQGDVDIKVNLMSFAAYQRIYQDWYRNPQWERRTVSGYNLSMFYGDNKFPSEVSAILHWMRQGGFNMFEMRYADYHKDYFMGLYPQQQFGEVALAGSHYLGIGNVTGGANSHPVNVKTNSVAGLPVGSAFTAVENQAYPLYSELSIVELRRAQALQRWKEVTMTNGSSMFQQVKAHFGFELPEGRKDVAEYVGGFDNVISIQDVNATATSGVDDDTSFLGQVGGKGLGVSDSSKTIEFTSKDFGLLMVVYHCEPYLDYNAVGVKRFNTKLSAGDFYLPEFDKIGFGSVNSYELVFNLAGQSSLNNSQILGYTSRYLDYKTSYDRVHGSFMPSFGNDNDAAWVVALTQDYLLGLLESGSIDWRFFKVSPRVANNVMVVPIDDYNGQEVFPFMVSADFRYYKSSNMSVDSLPY